MAHRPVVQLQQLQQLQPEDQYYPQNSRGVFQWRFPGLSAHRFKCSGCHCCSWECDSLPTALHCSTARHLSSRSFSPSTLPFPYKYTFRSLLSRKALEACLCLYLPLGSGVCPSLHPHLLPQTSDRETLDLNSIHTLTLLTGTRENTLSFYFFFI